MLAVVLCEFVVELDVVNVEAEVGVDDSAEFGSKPRSMVPARA